MRIVTDGEKFALAKGNRWFFGIELADLQDPEFWWLSERYQNLYCWGKLEEVQKIKEHHKNHKKKFWRYRKGRDNN